MRDAFENRRLRMAMIGGGLGSFIGPVHRIAAELDGEIQLVAGAFSRSADVSHATGTAYRIDSDRAYASYWELLDHESARQDGADFIAICTPNSSHLPIAVAALDAGFPVICDKPATATYYEALTLRDAVSASAGVYALTYTYTGYPMLREARHLCTSGGLGPLRKVVVEYTQGWLSEEIERLGSRQAGWRVDPMQAGQGGCVGDIGVHAFNALEFVTGLTVSELLADLNTVVAGRTLDDDCNVLVRMDNGAPGVIHTSQIAAGARNGLRVRVWGERGGLDWRQERPNTLNIDWRNGHSETRHAGSTELSHDGAAACRLPPGHPEGYIEAFANIYREFAQAVRRGELGPSGSLQTIDDGIRSLAFVDRAVASSQSRAWLRMPLHSVGFAK